MGTLWFILILLTAPQVNLEQLRMPESLPVVNYSFPGELIFNTPSFLIDSTGRTEEEITHTEFNTSYREFHQALMAYPSIYYFWIRLPVQNNTDDTLYPYFYFGYLDHIRFYFISSGHNSVIVNGGSLAGIHKSKPYIEQASLSFPLTLLPGQSGDIFVQIKQETAEYSLDTIQIYNKQLLYASFGENYEKTRYSVFFQILFMGFVLSQMIYAFLQWIIIRRREYLYYFFYLVAIAAYFFSKREIKMGIDIFFSIHPVISVYMNKALIILPYFLYFRFVRYFLEMDEAYPVINKWFIRIEYFLLGYLAVDLIFVSIHFYQKLQAEIYTVVIGLVFLASVTFIIYLFTQKKRLIYYVLTGSLFTAAGNITGLIFTFLNDYDHMSFHINDFLIFSQVGILVEIFCFTLGLSYKSKLNEKEKIQSQTSLIQQLKANEALMNRMQNIRNKIARDLHDDIGSTLSTILLYSNTAIRKIDNPIHGETLNIIHKIGESAGQMMDEMNDIVWTINPMNDDMEKIVNRMRLLALSLSSSADIRLDFHSDDNVACQKISMDKRKNCYLIFKEALNNAIKYSGCTEIKISLSKHHELLEMHLSDNGKGFDLHTHREGNGLYNMTQRAEEIGGKLVITSEAGMGASITLSFIIE